MVVALAAIPVYGACPQPPETEGAERKGLGRRLFLKGLRHEVNLFGGVYASDMMGAAPLAGASYTFHINEDFALEAGFAYARLSSSFSDPVESFTGYNILESHNAFLYSGNLVWHPFHGKFMFFRSGIPHFDFYFLAGVGITDSKTSKGLTYSVGGGIKIFTTQWLSVRVEIRDNIHVQQLLDAEALTNNLSLTLGVGFWIPFES
jgi:outer membrane beta-barrel protein